jgi:hypothetical protein
MTQTKPDAAELETRLKSVIDYVQDCERRVLRGEIMDLQGLDRNVIEICDAVANLPRKESQKIEDRMTQLIDMLEVLSKAMRAQQDGFTSARSG